MRGEDVRDSGVHYLEYESLEVEVRRKVWKVFGSPVSSIKSGVSHIWAYPSTCQAAARYSFGAFQYETEDEAVGVSYLRDAIDCGMNVSVRSCLLQDP